MKGVIIFGVSVVSVLVLVLLISCVSKNETKKDNTKDEKSTTNSNTLKEQKDTTTECLTEDDVKEEEKNQKLQEEKQNQEHEIRPRKPVIYLYPESDMKISVKIESDKISHTYPKYENGWEVFAKKDGMLTNLKTNTEHYCLFWEGINTNAYSFDEGFVVKGDDSIKFLEEKLEILGLNRKEANEFIIYWLPQLEQNQLNLIKFVTKEYNKDYPLVVSPKPDSIIRVFMIFKKIDAIDGTIKEQKLIPAKRKGFSVIEWGGSEIE